VRCLIRFLFAFFVLPLGVLFAAGCATVTGTPNQGVSIHIVDAMERPVTGMRCHVSNASAEYFGDAPMRDLQVRRSSSDLLIECHRGGLVARGTAVSRGSMVDGAVKALLPGGTAMLAVDHLSGYRYAYPNWIQLRVGEHLVFDADRQVPGKPAPGLLADLP
jgi:hypothetical protein